MPRPASPSTRRTLLAAAGLTVLLLASALLAVALSRGAGTPVPPEAALSPRAATLTDRPAPDERFELPQQTLAGFAGGRPVDLSEFGGRPLVVNFWATWCAPCVREIPELQRVAAEVGDQVAFLGVNVQDAAVNAEPFAERLDIGYPLAVDASGEFFSAVGGFGMPTTLLVDATSDVVYRHTGELTADELQQLLRRHFGKIAHGG